MIGADDEIKLAHSVNLPHMPHALYRRYGAILRDLVVAHADFCQCAPSLVRPS